MAAIAGTSGVRVYELTAGGKKQLCGERVALAASAAINRFLREA